MERVDVFRQSAGLPTDSDAQISAKQSKANRADPMRELEQQLGLQIGFLDIHGEPEKHSKQANQSDRSDQADQSKRSTNPRLEETSTQATPSPSTKRHAPYYDDSLRTERRNSPERRIDPMRRNDPERRNTPKNPASMTYEEQVQDWFERGNKREPGAAHPRYSPPDRTARNERPNNDGQNNDNRRVWKEAHGDWLKRVKDQMEKEQQPNNNQRRGPDVISNNRLEAAFSALENHEIAEMDPRSRRYPEKTLPATAVALAIQRAYGYELRQDQNKSSYGVGLLEDAILDYGWVKSTDNPGVGDIVLAVRDDGTEDAGIFAANGRIFGIDNKGTTFRYSGWERFNDPKYSKIALYKKIR